MNTPIYHQYYRTTETGLVIETITEAPEYETGIALGIALAIPTGRFRFTDTALSAMALVFDRFSMMTFIGRHAFGQWDDMPREDAQKALEAALRGEKVTTWHNLPQRPDEPIIVISIVSDPDELGTTISIKGECE